VERVECIIRAEWTRVGRIPDLARRIGELQHDLDSLLGLEDGPAAR
jgi:hypothetical protein